MSAAESMRRYREAHPEMRERDQKLANARKEALRQLADAHPAQYLVLLHAVCADMGIDPPGSRPTGRPSGGAK